jgi:hypothetical protein
VDRMSVFIKLLDCMHRCDNSKHLSNKTPTYIKIQKWPQQ